MANVCNVRLSGDPNRSRMSTVGAKQTALGGKSARLLVANFVLERRLRPSDVA
jgi:hypothetical protein